MDTLEQYRKQKYINLETFRKNGEGVKTPVWFVENGNSLYVITVADSWKVKRIRKDNRVRVAPCRVNGQIIGRWQQARVKEVSAPELLETVNRLYRKKYGLLNAIFTWQQAKKGSQSTTLEIRFEE